MDDVPAFDGYILGRQLADGSWLARETASRASVVVRAVPVASDEQRSRLRSRLSACAAAGYPHLLAARDVHDEPERVVVAHDAPRRGNLADLLATRGGLTAGEVVTMAVPLGQALAALHASGATYGELSTSAVGFDADGRPVLAPTTAVLAAEVRDDVAGLVQLCRCVLDDAASPALAAAFDGVERDAGPADLGRRAAAAIEAAPITFSVGREGEGIAASVVDRGRNGAHRLRASLGHRAGRPATGSAGSRGLRPGRGRAARLRPGRGRAARLRRWGAPAGALAIAGVAVVAGLAWGAAGASPANRLPATPSPAGHARPPTASASPAPPAATRAPARARPAAHWGSIVERLTARRAHAFAAADPAALQRAEAAGSSLLAADEATVRKLTAAGRHARGLRRDVRSARRVGRDDDVVTLRVVDALSSYTIMDGRGNVVRRVPARGASAFTLTLRESAAGWRIASVRPAATDAR